MIETRGRRFKLPAANRIREHRRRLRLSLDDVAERAGLSRAEIHKLEIGLRPIRPDHLIRLGAAFNVRPEELVWPEEAERLLGTLLAPVYDRLQVRGRVVGTSIVDFDKSFGEFSITLPHGLSRGGYVVYNPRTGLKWVQPGAALVLTTIVPAKAGDLVVSLLEREHTANVELFDGNRPRGHEIYKVAAILPQ